MGSEIEIPKHSSGSRTESPLTALSGRELLHEGIRPERARDLTPERVFAEEWKKENERLGAVNFGLTALELILNSKPCPAQQALGHNYHNDIDRPTQRDATVAASIIQWLGTRCGAVFLDRVERRIEEERTKGLVAHNAKWNTLGTHNGTAQEMGTTTLT